MPKTLFIFTIMLLLCTASCSSESREIDGSGPYVLEVIDAKPFDALNLWINGKVNLYLKESETYSVSLGAKKNILPIITTSFSNNRFRIEEGYFYPNAVVSQYYLSQNAELDVFLTTPALSSIDGSHILCGNVFFPSSSFEIGVHTQFEADSIKARDIRIDGGSEGTFRCNYIEASFVDLAAYDGFPMFASMSLDEIHADSVRIASPVNTVLASIRDAELVHFETNYLYSGMTIELGEISGNTQTLKITGSTYDTNNSSIWLTSLVAKEVIIDNFASNRIFVHAVESLDVRDIGENGEVYYTGDPQITYGYGVRPGQVIKYKE